MRGAPEVRSPVDGGEASVWESALALAACMIAVMSAAGYFGRKASYSWATSPKDSARSRFSKYSIHEA
ncbi:hypothetical protein [Brevibacterium iodinum]|uniref:hypothetical protein n=1 Tax=Brevibacterium iodinum TaxID=31943 RepID=UPI000E1A7216|nr:hypothetical protein [Brevibacterium iodinum]SUW14069.1 Uncharacterised protein [Brevibacterium iodinum]